MDEILANKPVDLLENADSSVKSYVMLLEKKLKSCMTMDILNQEIERKLFVTLEELHSLKMQNKDGQDQEELMKCKVNNTVLDIENKQLKQQIIMLQEEVLQLRFAAISRIQEAVSNTKEIKQIRTNSIADNDPNANSVLIKGFAEHQLHWILKTNIINLGHLMNLKVLDKDIVEVIKMERKYYERHNMQPNKIILIARLRTPELKIEFLKNKQKLKASRNFVGIEISDYVSDEVYNLYQYAKILKSFGYAQIYWRNNCVYAKKTRSTYCDPVLIKTKADVDNLKN